MHLCLLKSHLSCLAVCIYFVLNSAQSSGREKWKCDSEELLERKLVVYFVLHYSQKRFFRKGFDPAHSISKDCMGENTKMQI